MPKDTANVTQLRDSVDHDDAYEQSVKPRRKKDVRRAKDVLRSAELAADRNRWFVFCILLVVVIVVLAFQLTSLSNSAATNYKVAWVKMDPSGTFKIELSETQAPHTYLRATVEGILAQWVRRRFSEVPESIRSDYGYALQFLSPRLKSEFTSEEGFNASQKAADVRTNRAHGAVIYEVGVIDHYDQDPNGMFAGGTQSTIYRTNIYVLRKEILPGGGQRTEPDKRFITLEWRLMSRREIGLLTNKDGGIDWLHVNPVGLEIISYNENDDISDLK